MLPYNSYASELPSPFTQLLSFRGQSYRSVVGFDILPLEVLRFDNLRLALSAVAESTTALDQWYHDGQLAEHLTELCEYRTRAHHMTLSLKDIALVRQEQFHFSTPAHASMYAVVRLTLLIYNNLVIFPLPTLTGIDTLLADMLASRLSDIVQDSPKLFTECSRLMLWVLMLGGISDSKDVHRAWYKDRFQEILKQLSLRKWLEIENCLASFLWCDFVLNTEAARFWSEK